MLTDDRPDNELIRELYAMFGLAYYNSECLHRSLAILLAYSKLPPLPDIIRPRAEENLSQAFSLTLGEVIGKLRDVLPSELIKELRKATEVRNFLAHYFWFERAHLMFSAQNVHQLLAELDGYANFFDHLDNLVSERLAVKRKELGITDKDLQVSMNLVLAGAVEPLLRRRNIIELEKKLYKRQRLIRVWEVTLDGGSKYLIFELADGSLWQLSDVGLSWSYFREVGPGWKEHPSVKPHLPADILPRPKVAAPWDYEFTLANGAILWVKPGQQKGTFTWGVRTPKTD